MGALVGWGHWCGAAVPTMMKMVTEAQAKRLYYTHSNYLQLMESEEGNICNVIVEGGRCRLHKNFLFRF